MFLDEPLRGHLIVTFVSSLFVEKGQGHLNVISAIVGVDGGLIRLVNLASRSCTANSVGYCKWYVDNGTSVAVQVGLVLCWHYLEVFPVKLQ